MSTLQFHPADIILSSADIILFKFSQKLQIKKHQLICFKLKKTISDNMTQNGCKYFKCWYYKFGDKCRNLNIEEKCGDKQREIVNCD